MGVSELHSKMDSREIAEWQAFFLVEKRARELAELGTRAERSRLSAKKSLKGK